MPRPSNWPSESPACHAATAWKPATKVDHAQVIGACFSCHNGTTASGKPAGHIPATGNCLSCHTTAAWTPSPFNHTQVTVTGQCTTCHSGAYPAAGSRPTTHVPYQLLTGVVVTNCDTCHKAGYSSWIPAKLHLNTTVTTQCATCHARRTRIVEEAAPGKPRCKGRAVLDRQLIE